MDLLERLVPRLLATPAPSEEYYGVRFVGRSGGVIERSCHSHWVGFKDDDIRREIRQASVLRDSDVVQYRDNVSACGEDCMVIRTTEDLILFYLAGGNALIERRLAESRPELSDLIGPRVVVRTGQFGFTALASLPSTVLNRAPTPRQRMAVLKRDDYRCRICGRRPTDDVDVQLHVHHIRPWARGGVTVEENLIVLCHTCHTGLDPHEELRLFGLGSDRRAPEGKSAGTRRYREGLEHYWTASVQGLKQRSIPPLNSEHPTARPRLPARATKVRRRS